MWFVTIHRECRKGVSARAENGSTACGDGRSARTLRSDESAIGVTTDNSRRVREFGFCSFDTAGPAAMTAVRAERPISGAKLARMSRPNRTEVLLFPMLAYANVNLLIECSPS